jgi:prepilin-type N-terminal cleavage/methylation domain-containing protein
MKHLRHAREIVGRERGDTLIELLIVMLILLIVIGALAGGFASATKAEVDQSNRAGDQQNAREALDRMRLDIHCALSIQPASPIVNGAGVTTGYLLTLPQPNTGCPGVATGGSSAIQWCTVLKGLNHYTLYRSTIDCTVPADSKFQVDYVTQANVWPTGACVVGEYPRVTVELPVNRDPVRRASRTYELNDAIAIRNALPPAVCS